MSQRVNVMYVLNAADGGATEGVLQLLHGLRYSRYRAFVVVPQPPGCDRGDQIRSVAHRVAVVPMGWWNQKVTLPLWYRPVEWARTNLRTGAHAFAVRSLSRLIREWDIDLVYTNTAMILDGALAARLTRRPHVWHVKEWVGRHARTRFPLSDPALARLMSERLSDRLVAMTRFIAEPFLEYGRADRVRVVYDGVDLHRFGGAANAGELRARLGVDRDDVLVAMAASLRSLCKRPELFLEMAARLAPRAPNVRFAMFGSVPVKYRNPVYNEAWRRYCTLRDRARAMGLGDRINIGVFCANIPQMMDAIDVLVHPCEVEGFGRVAIEAMAARRPVVGPAAGGIAESVVDGDTGFLVRPRDALALAEAAETLVADPELRSRMGQAGRTRAERVFSLAGHVERMQGVFEEILSR